MLASVATFAIEGIASREVSVEVDVRRGLPTFTLVGLPDRAVREARERVRAALLNSGLDFPQQRLTVNLAPAHVRKAGPGFDLAIAVGVMAATGQVPKQPLESCALYGELSLSGELRRGRGALAVALGARDAGYARLAAAPGDAGEAALVSEVEVIPVESLEDIARLLRGERPAERASPRPPRRRGPEARLDLADVRGQEDAKRALEIAAAGSHNMLMVGPPGAGKTMLARRLPGILPPPSFEEALEITRIGSVAGIGGGELVSERPFRAPHHTISPQGLTGGGLTPRPGEVTLAHRGVLFLDELAEFSRPALDALRQPLEEGRVEIMRGQRTIVFPARAMVVAATNPCPCGRPADACSCDAVLLGRYARRLSGPLLDRIDLVCRLGPVAPLELVREVEGDGTSRRVRRRVLAARERQQRRLEGSGALCNGDMDGRLTRRTVRLGRRLRARLASLPDPGLLSGRGHDRVLRVARTIADLDEREEVGERDLDEALAYRLGAVAAAA
ncbi:MAG TPA: YifB family Mg chelatase-like AAA ATPase [Thermoleophilaceae bacterium]